MIMGNTVKVDTRPAELVRHGSAVQTGNIELRYDSRTAQDGGPGLVDVAGGGGVRRTSRGECAG